MEHKLYDWRSRTYQIPKGKGRRLDVIQGGADIPSHPDQQLPAIRAECKDGYRPCPLVSCRHNLYLDVNPSNGSLTVRYRNRGPEDMPPHQSCALDVADAGVHTLEQLGQIFGLTRERIRQIEERAREKLRETIPELEPTLKQLLDASGEDHDIHMPPAYPNKQLSGVPLSEENLL